MEIKTTINLLATTKCYLPGYKSGGPLRSLSNMAAKLGREFQFRIVTYDRDSGENMPYQGIRIGNWNNVGNSLVYYIPHEKWSILKWRKLLSTTQFDVLYLNSFFSPQFTILPLMLRRLGLIPDAPLIVAPRGEFSSGALEIKKWRKKAYIFLAKMTGLYNGLLWHASSDFEKKDIERIMGRGKDGDVDIHIAGDLAEITGLENKDSSAKSKSSGIVRFVFLSRIARMKNLDGALRMLEGAKGRVDFDIYGPVEDASYWDGCLEIIKRLPENIRVTYRGTIPHEFVQETLSGYHFFYFPTLGENFGHVIHEALSAGLPVILSDQTPWRHLVENGIGWDLPLSRPEEFQSVLNRCVEMDECEYKAMSCRASIFTKERDLLNNALSQNMELFRKAVSVSRDINVAR